MASESDKRSEPTPTNNMAPDESDCENFTLETAYKLYFNLKKELWATEHPPNKISYSSSGVLPGSAVTGQ